MASKDDFLSYKSDKLLFYKESELVLFLGTCFLVGEFFLIVESVNDRRFEPTELLLSSSFNGLTEAC